MGSNMDWRPKTSRCCLLVLVLDAMGHGAYSQCYDIEVLPVWDCGVLGEENLFGEGMNDSGQVAGWRFDCFVGPDVAAAWFGGPELTTLPLPKSIAWHARANAINGSGAVVGGGMLSDSAGYGHAFLVLDGKAIDLGTLPGDNDSSASDLNDSLQVVGRSQTSAVLWENENIIELDLPFGTSSGARAINQSGEIVGWMGTSPVIDAHAFLWSKSGAIDLGVIPGGVTSVATAVNALACVVGYGIIPDPKMLIVHPFRWHDGVMNDLGTLPDFDACGATDVNDDNAIVGVCEKPGELSRGWIWRNGVMTDLNDLIDPALDIHIASADAINNKGQILVRGLTPDGTRSIILTPKNASPTDLTADCLTDMTDLVVLLDQWGPKPPVGGADFNADGLVNAADLAELLANWG